MTVSASPANYSVPSNKITEYLLNVDHPVGGSKARFFLSFGFRLDNAFEMGAALNEHAAFNGPGVEKIDARGMPTLIVEGPIKTPDGRNPIIRTVWIMRSPDLAEFVTAYPCR